MHKNVMLMPLRIFVVRFSCMKFCAIMLSGFPPPIRIMVRGLNKQKHTKGR